MEKQFNTVEDIIGIIFHEGYTSKHYKINRIEKSGEVGLEQVKGGTYITTWNIGCALDNLNKGSWKVVSRISQEPVYEIY